ncbi:HNH endonuclease signature motif containing protein [Methylobacterium sp. J-092]|uniref:HNH endonuclease signature motif containing protein n=1 Tax=Methylobacterium sp. J-092 TaxID=2836667 RepID=UPI001FBA763F|nr:HNH endonuclease signature motif containing protein [Methylobacterium sp. J-092]MCJ2009767.1 HNH endonuclease [Methylobacterium sp. J-092]
MSRDRAEFSKPVKRTAWERAAGKCEFVLVDGSRCGCPLTPGKFAYDHINPDGLTGTPTLSNCQVICTPCHLAKTREDVKHIAQAKRREDAHLGIKRPASLQSQGFRRYAPARRATTPVDKLTLGYRRPGA